MLENLGRKEQVTIEDTRSSTSCRRTRTSRRSGGQLSGPTGRRAAPKYLHTLGNLTLTGYNSEYSDHPFAKKRDMEGGFEDSPLRLNKGLGQLEHLERGRDRGAAERLADEALKIWTRPALQMKSSRSSRAQGTKSGFSIEDHPYLLPPPRRALFERLSSEVLALDPAITRQFLKLYVAFKAETNFVDVVPQKARMRLSLNIPIEALRDERGLAWDVSGKGHWGNGPTEVGLDEDSDFAYIIGFRSPGFEYQMGGD